MTDTANVIVIGLTRDDLQSMLRSMVSEAVGEIVARTPAPASPEREYDYEEAAKLMKISEHALGRLKNAKKIGFYRKGGRVTFGDHHIREYRERCDHPAVEPSSAKPRLIRSTA